MVGALDTHKKGVYINLVNAWFLLLKDDFSVFLYSFNIKMLGTSATWKFKFLILATSHASIPLCLYLVFLLNQGNDCLPRNDLAPPVGVELGVLAISEVDVELLFGPRVEAEVSLVGEVVRVEKELDEARLRDERLRLLGLTAEEPRLFSVAHFRLRVTVHDLQVEKAR